MDAAQREQSNEIRENPVIGGTRFPVVVIQDDNNQAVGNYDKQHGQPYHDIGFMYILPDFHRRVHAGPVLPDDQKRYKEYRHREKDKEKPLGVEPTRADNGYGIQGHDNVQRHVRQAEPWMQHGKVRLFREETRRGKNRDQGKAAAHSGAHNEKPAGTVGSACRKTQ